MLGLVSLMGISQFSIVEVFQTIVTLKVYAVCEAFYTSKNNVS